MSRYFLVTPCVISDIMTYHRSVPYPENCYTYPDPLQPTDLAAILIYKKTFVKVPKHPFFCFKTTHLVP
jgi:hypothetical protein